MNRNNIGEQCCYYTVSVSRAGSNCHERIHLGGKMFKVRPEDLVKSFPANKNDWGREN